MHRFLPTLLALIAVLFAAGPVGAGVEVLPELAYKLALSASPAMRIPKALRPLRPVKVVMVEVTVVADAPCLFTVDGGAAVALEENVPLEVEIAAGSRKLTASSTKTPAAIWTETVQIEAPKPRRVRIPMLKTLRETHLKERREAVFRDEKTDLMWARRDGGLDVTWKAAAAFCEQSTLAGFEDWRLPTLAELETLHAIWSQREFKILDPFVLTACCPWSTDLDGDERVWNFNFRFRKPFSVNGHLSLGLRALCVRDWVAEEPTEEPAGEPAPAEKPAPAKPRPPAPR